MHDPQPQMRGANPRPPRHRSRAVPSGDHRGWLQKYLLDQKAVRNGNGFTTLFEDLRQFWSWYAADEGTVSPMDGLPRPKTVVTTVPVLTADQVRKILAGCSGPGFEDVRNRALVLVLLQAGLRRMEASALNIGDIDLHEHTVTVARGKVGRPRVAVIGDDARQAIWKWLKLRRRQAAGLGQPCDESCPLFTAVQTGRRLGPAGVGAVITRLGQRAGIPDLHPHQFRHTWAHENLASGIQEHGLMHLAGWTSTKQIGRYGAAERAVIAGRRHAVRIGLGSAR